MLGIPLWYGSIMVALRWSNPALALCSESAYSSLLDQMGDDRTYMYWTWLAMMDQKVQI